MTRYRLAAETVWTVRKAFIERRQSIKGALWTLVEQQLAVRN
jgi:hypothetical protein